MIRFLKEDTDNNLYQQLVDFMGGNISNTEIEDDLIKKVNPNGTVIIDFNDMETYLEIFDGTLDYTDKSYISCAYSYYCDFNMFDSYQHNEDWNEGYLLRNINDENKEILKKILRILSPGLIEGMFEEHDDKAWKNASELLRDTFSRDVDDMVTDYNTDINQVAKDKLIAMAEEELCEIFEEVKIYLFGNCFDTYYTTVKSILQLYKQTEDFQTDLKGLLKNYVDSEVNLHSFYEELWDSQYLLREYDEGYQPSWKKSLENMLEKLEDSDMFLDLEEYKQLGKLLSKYNYGTYYRLPKDRTMEFRIIRIIPETNLISVDIRNIASQRILNYEVDLEQFNLILYHPELFRKFYD